MVTRWIFGNQLCKDLPILKDADKDEDVILMVEAESRALWESYHKQKLTLIFSGMRHFAKELEEKGFTVDYRKADSFREGWKEHKKAFNPNHVHITQVTDDRMRRALEKWEDELPEKIEVHYESEKPMFLLSKDEVKERLPGDGPWQADSFYRNLRKDLGVLMDGDDPIGGKWSFDQENRKPAKSGMDFPKKRTFRPDEITQQVMDEVNENYGDNPGELDSFEWPVTRKEALKALNQFISDRLPTFGTYQDAMLIGNADMSHSLLSSAINMGLLQPMEVIEKAEQAYHDGEAPLNAVEGFIRQIIGWREYMRGIYVKKMPDYKQVNELNHDTDLPSFFYTGKTKMKCMEQSIQPVIEKGYSHHIQRLMVLGNFANLFGISPQQTADWFNEMYIDAYDWVVLPNVLGMALFADGGLLSTKPYVSSANYIHKMSDYCNECPFHPKHKTEEDACPFNALYWDFLDRHEDRLGDNPRMKLIYSQWSKKDQDDKQAIKKKASSLKQQLTKGSFHE
ncbi:cryptochrome/photolyase family protein [Halobacillus locisalis]|uniref:Cryptochrome/photolyase family protein n=1 Tax=Halobacillus locisalis TaxID=220753 RepID=A0A838CU74_9BACI|nr:cryptochrome/photolyase family protein [Halobacillus locisalis]MBA2175471.1 cryptochrome/photolyase family protein [Halobacillus locisalis]